MWIPRLDLSLWKVVTTERVEMQLYFIFNFIANEKYIANDFIEQHINAFLIISFQEFTK